MCLKLLNNWLPDNLGFEPVDVVQSPGVLDFEHIRAGVQCPEFGRKPVLVDWPVFNRLRGPSASVIHAKGLDCLRPVPLLGTAAVSAWLWVEHLRH
jgi:hypothetical protein